MYSPSLVSASVCVILFVGQTMEPAQAQLEQLALKIPDTANALVIINCEAVRSSPLAVQKSWQSRREAENSGMIALPPRATWLLMAADMDFEFMQPIWEAAVAYMPDTPTMEQVAARTGGRLDRLAGTQAVERPNDSYVVSLGPRVVGAISPAQRQNVIRWVRETRGKKKVDLSPYLQEALKSIQQDSQQVVVALSLGGILAPPEVAKAFEQSKVLTEGDSKKLVSLVAGIVGARLEITFSDTADGVLRITFLEDATPLADVAKPLLLEILNRLGAHLDDLENWHARAEQKEVILEGKLTSGGLRRLQTILSGPVGPWSAQSEEDASGSELVAQASQQYFQSVTGYLNDLFGGDIRPQSLNQIGVWVERYARKIEDLDQSHVDEDLLAFAADAVMSLREIGTIVQRAEQRSDLREATMFNWGRSRYGRYGAYGYYEKPYVTRDRQLIQADEASRGLSEAGVIVDELRQKSANTRRLMSDRYQREF